MMNRKTILCAIMMVLALLATFTAANQSFDFVDIASRLTANQWSCFKGQTKMAVIRAFRSVGKIDEDLVANVKAAQAAGYSVDNTHIYMYPCTKSIGCSISGLSQQFDALWSYLTQNNLKVGFIWLDIEKGSGDWPGSKNTNRLNLEVLLKQAKKYTKNVGVYSNYYAWEDMFGLDYKTDTTGLKLWYSRYNSKDCSDFQAFGGWTKPYAKQYQGDVTQPCGVDHDKSMFC